MSSPISTSAPNPIPGTSGGAGAIASVAAAAQNPVMQIDQTKIPVFHSNKDKDSLTIFNWCDRVDRMKDALDWNDETFPNASAALFGVAQRTASNWAILYKAEHPKIWTYLKKKMISHFGNMQSSRSFIDAMFGIRQPIILYMDDRPQPELSHLHKKTYARFHAAVLQYNFVIQNKTGSGVPLHLRTTSPLKINAMASDNPKLLHAQEVDPDLQLIKKVPDD